MDYAFVVMKTGDTRPGPDFFGEVAGEGGDHGVALANPVAIQYSNMVPEFVTDFMPLSMHLTYREHSVVVIPRDNILYTVVLPENETMSERYREFIGRYTSPTASTN